MEHSTCISCGTRLLEMLNLLDTFVGDGSLILLWDDLA